jgi:hypothetical protein
MFENIVQHITTTGSVACSVRCPRRYVFACGSKFTGRKFGSARALINYRELLETYCTAKREL